MKIIFIITVSAFYLFAHSGFTFGQICSDDPCTIDSTSSGEVASAAIDNFLLQASRNKERIFIIARLSTNEIDAKLNLYRLCAARQYILSHLPKDREINPMEKYSNLPSTVFAEGERIQGEARLEFYIGSRLQLIRLMGRNKAANLNCCEDYTSEKRRLQRNECRKWRKKGKLENH